ncbi:MAG: glycosyltransferase family 39 protein [Planctomycetes bacterium]|nr:glycosyltransferase family 39 protein [Planctomycetota bacterium]
MSLKTTRIIAPRPARPWARAPDLSPAFYRRALLGLVLVALLLRLWRVDRPLLEVAEWRQAFTAYVSYRMYAHGASIFAPEIPLGGREDPRVGDTEFPLYNALCALAATLSGGWSDAASRVVSILFTGGTLLLVADLAAARLSRRTALWTVFLLAVAENPFLYSRAAMPEPAMLFFSTGMLWAAERFGRSRTAGGERRGDGRWLAASAAFGAAAFLVKPPALCLALPAWHLAAGSGGVRGMVRLLRHRRVLAASLLAVAPMAAWLLHISRVGEETGHSMGGPILGGAGKMASAAVLIDPLFYQRLGETCFIWLLGVPAGVLFALGALFSVADRRYRFVFIWLAAWLAAFAILGEGFKAHHYYGLPAALPAAMFAARCLSAPLWPPRGGPGDVRTLFRFAAIMLSLAVAATSLAAVYRRLGPKRDAKDEIALRAAREIASRAAPGEPVVVYSLGGPELLYLSKRPGWTPARDWFVKPEHEAVFLDWLEKRRRDDGARWFVLTHRTPDDARPERSHLTAALLRSLLARHRAVVDEKHLLVLELRP